MAVEYYYWCGKKECKITVTLGSLQDEVDVRCPECTEPMEKVYGRTIHGDMPIVDQEEEEED